MKMHGIETFMQNVIVKHQTGKYLLWGQNVDITKFFICRTNGHNFYKIVKLLKIILNYNSCSSMFQFT